jgi:hypothetical protein
MGVASFKGASRIGSLGTEYRSSIVRFVRGVLAAGTDVGLSAAHIRGRLVRLKIER